jgi:hypothetical protein
MAPPGQVNYKDTLPSGYVYLLESEHAVAIFRTELLRGKGFLLSVTTSYINPVQSLCTPPYDKYISLICNSEKNPRCTPANNSTTKHISTPWQENTGKEKKVQSKRTGAKAGTFLFLFLFWFPTIILPMEEVAARPAVAQRSRRVGATSDYPPQARSR